MGAPRGRALWAHIKKLAFGPAQLLADRQRLAPAPAPVKTPVKISLDPLKHVSRLVQRNAGQPCSPGAPHGIQQMCPGETPCPTCGEGVLHCRCPSDARIQFEDPELAEWKLDSLQSLQSLESLESLESVQLLESAV